MPYVSIQLTTAGSDTGPFNLYSNADGFISAFETDVPKSSLLSGIVVEVPVGTVVVRISSFNQECSNYIDIPIMISPSEYLFIYGTLEVPGAMVDIPDSGDIDMSLGESVTDQNTNDPIYIPFNSDVDDFLWFAIPSDIAIKTSWYVSLYNQGDIGGPADAFGNLFSDPTIVSYLGTDYNLYISTVRTNLVSINIS